MSGELVLIMTLSSPKKEAGFFSQGLKNSRAKDFAPLAPYSEIRSFMTSLMIVPMVIIIRLTGLG